MVIFACLLINLASGKVGAKCGGGCPSTECCGSTEKTVDVSGVVIEAKTDICNTEDKTIIVIDDIEVNFKCNKPQEDRDFAKGL